MANYSQLIGAGLREAREVTSKEIVERSNPSGDISIPLELATLSVDDGEICNITRGPEGWGSTTPARRIVRRIGTTIDPTAKRTRGRFIDLHTVPLLGSLDSLSSPQGGNMFADGIAQILPHNGLFYFRASPAFVYNPQTQRIQQIPPHRAALEEDGTLFERAATNLFTNPSFNGAGVGAAWGTFGGGVNGSSVSLSASASPFFEPSNGAGMPNYCEIIAGNPHAGNAGVYQQTASLSANLWVTLSIDHVEDASDPLFFELTRDFDGKDYNYTTGTWGAPVFNTVPLRSTPGRAVFAPLNVGTSATRLTLTVFAYGGGAASRVSRLFHMQLEPQRWASSRLASDGATGTRGEVDYSYENASTRRVFPATRSSTVLRVIPNFSSSQVAGDQFYFFTVFYDASNEIYLKFDSAASGQLSFIRKSGGVSSGIIKTLTITRDVPVYIVIRCASTTDGELDARYGAAPGGEGNFDLWAGPAGALVCLGNFHSVPPVETTASRIQLGGRVGECAEARIALVRMVPRIITDEEIQRWAQ